MKTHAKVRLLTYCLSFGLAAAAQAGPTDAIISSAGGDSDANAPSVFQLHQSAYRTTRFVRIQGELWSNGLGGLSAIAQPREQAIAMFPPGNTNFPFCIPVSNVSSFAASNYVPVDTFMRLPMAVIGPAGAWTVRLTSMRDTDPNKVEAYWTTLTVTLNDGPPAFNTDLGSVSAGGTSRSATITAHETKWFKFTLPIDMNFALGHYMDIDTEGTNLGGGSNDTEIALYNEDGIRVGYDDDDGSNAMSQLTYGAGLRANAGGGGLNYDGRDGTGLPAGTYYLGVRGYELNAPKEVGWDFSNSNVALRSGAIRVNIHANFGQPIGCPADFNRSGGVEVQDIFDFLNSWFVGCP